MMIPTIHLNGTSREGLVRPLCDAVVAIQDAMEALAKCMPNARDYYVQGSGVTTTAINEHDARMTKLREVMMEVSALAETLINGPDR